LSGPTSGPRTTSVTLFRGDFGHDNGHGERRINGWDLSRPLLSNDRLKGCGRSEVVVLRGRKGMTRSNAFVAASSFLLPSPNRRTLAHVFVGGFLCVLSYFLGIYTNYRPSLPPQLAPVAGNPEDCHPLLLASPSSSDGPLHFLPRHAAANLIPLASVDQPSPPVPFCAANFTHYCPCQDPDRERRFITVDLVHRERHCPGPDDRPPRCRVPRPPGYRAPLPWPASRDRAWFANVPSTKLSEAKKDQNWVRVEGNWLVFPGGGTSFIKGVKWYVAEMAKQVPLRSGEIRTVLDIGCGVGSKSNFLLFLFNWIWMLLL
ncbi:hypothetical protein B296_00019538, partial [Ensete ventricosum]